jgi:hypothetical protein
MIDLDRTFVERTTINTAVVEEVDKASNAWGVTPSSCPRTWATSPA